MVEMADHPETQAAAGPPEDVAFQRYSFAIEDGAISRFASRLIHIGSAPDSDLVLPDPTVSRLHARLEFDQSGYLLRDLESKNGTSVDGVRIGQGYLDEGAVVTFGNTRCRFAMEDETIHVALARESSFGRLMGRSSQMREIFALLARVAPTDATVLVEGDSGTGKELVAEAIHGRSERRGGPWVVFDCSAVAPDLIESALFGHVKGAFTGAVADRMGVFEQADGGTLFVDEIGELPRELQAKLLRVLETGEVRPVGSSDVRLTDARVVVATNRRLDREVEHGGFREDLYYRLAVIRVALPPLHQRPEDIPLLVQHFLHGAGSQDVRVGFQTMEKLKLHPWPGNVRELKNYVERAVLLSDHGRLETRHLSLGGLREVAEREVPRGGVLPVDYELPFKDAKARLVDQFERAYWTRRLAASDGNVSEAARQAGIHRKSLEYLLKKLDLEARPEPP